MSEPTPAAFPPNALTVAGIDPSGGAGIYADLKTFSALGAYGTGVVAALTAQNTQAVTGVHGVPPEFVRLQLDTLFADVAIVTAKIGMLGTAPIARAVAEGLAAPLSGGGLAHLVVDPVMVAKSGDRLLDDDAVHAVRRSLLPVSRVVTPNVPEAEVLTGMSIRTPDDLQEAARRLAHMGPGAALVKGGHLDGAEVIDVLCEGGDIHVFSGPRISGPYTHGTGCTLAAAIAAGLARGRSLRDAVADARRYVADAMRHGIDVGRGHRPLGHLVGRINDTSSANSGAQRPIPARSRGTGALEVGDTDH